MSEGRMWTKATNGGKLTGVKSPHVLLQFRRRDEAALALRLGALVGRLAWTQTGTGGGQNEDAVCFVTGGPLSLPVCLRACAMSEDETEKDMPHRSHWYGFSPVCRRLW